MLEMQSQAKDHALLMQHYHLADKYFIQDNVTNNEVISEEPSLDLEGLDSSSMDSLESVKLALKAHQIL